MNVYSATCSCSVELYISSGITWRIFCQTVTLCGVFYVCIIYIAGRIIATAIAGDIIFFSLSGPVGDYSRAQTVISHGIFSIYSIIRQMEQAKLRWVEQGWGAGDTIFFKVPNSLEGCDGWGEGRGTLYLTMVVQWKDIRPWRPEFGPQGKHFASGNCYFLFLGDE
jgi:hypothetical protein